MPAHTDRHPIDDKYNFHEASFRRHYQLHFRDDARGFDFFAPAYRFGYELATESPGMSWERVKDAAERHWRANHQSDWSEMIDLIHYGWVEQRDPDSLRVHHDDDEYEEHRAAFAAHHADTIGEGVAPFEDYEPAYRRGYDMAVDPTYRTHLWSDVEPEVRNYYETEYAEGEVSWERYHSAVYHAWHRVRR
ncbi:hypothetical protein GC175_06310 [bacterium]|nr:hypothetical protein [bacterium]